MSDAEITSTELYKCLESGYDQITQDGKAEVFISKEEFPKVKNRNMLPVGIVNFSNDTLVCFSSMYPYTYRSDRNRYALSSSIAMGSSSTIVAKFPIGLLDAKVDCNHIILVY